MKNNFKNNEINEDFIILNIRNFLYNILLIPLRLCLKYYI